MKVSLIQRTCYEIRVAGRSLGLFAVRDGEWNGMTEVRELGSESGRVLVLQVHSAKPIERLASQILGGSGGIEADVLRGSPSLIGTLAKLAESPDPATLEVDSWKASA